MGLLGDGVEMLPRGEEGVLSEAVVEDKLPVFCWRIKRAKRDGVLGLAWMGDSEVGLPNTEINIRNEMFQ